MNSGFMKKYRFLTKQFLESAEKYMENNTRVNKLRAQQHRALLDLFLAENIAEQTDFPFGKAGNHG